MTDKDLIKKYVPEKKQTKAYKKLKKGYPVQYIIGNVDFNGYIINVNKNVLIPRFETELLCVKLKEYIKKYLKEPINIIDLGCGSGAISIYLKKEIKTDVTAVDISKKALKLAQKNAKENKVNINFIKHNILKVPQGNYDVIVSNPPYIDKKNDFVEEKVKKYEPNLALYAKNNGLLFYEKILSYSKDILNKKNIIAFEIGDKQATSIYNLAIKSFPKAKITIEKDLNGLDRFIFIINE